MARGLVIAAWVLAGCADAPVLEVPAPLFVFNSYPASGATLAVGDLGELSFTFSEDLGPREDVEAAVAGLVGLEDRSGPIDLGAPRYDPGAFTLTLALDDATRARLAPGGYLATVQRAVTSADGRSLATDFVVQFQLAVESRGADE